jgi:hypothetical protein
MGSHRRAGQDAEQATANAKTFARNTSPHIGQKLMASKETAHDFVQRFAVSADGWHFETDEDAARHDKALEKAVEERDLDFSVRAAKAGLVPADKLKELQDELDRLKAQAIEARALLTTAATFLMCDPDAVDTALVKEYGMVSSEDTRSVVEIIRDHLCAVERKRKRGIEQDSMHWQGRTLTGKLAHWCWDWDGLTVDETTIEIESCHCWTAEEKAPVQSIIDATILAYRMSDPTDLGAK